MSKNILVCSILLLICVSALSAAAPAKKPTATESLLIESFAKGDTTTSKKWWKFDRLNVADKKDSYGNYVAITGEASDWYVGGMGTYVGKDASAFSNIKMKVWGNGKNSGKLKVEIVEEDSGKPDAEEDKATYLPLKDDKFSSQEIPIDWQGWKTVVIPVSTLVLANPGAGDGEWNPTTKGGHYGLLKFQIIVLANSANGNANFGLRDIRLTK